MEKTKKVRRVRVVLTGAKSYKLGGRKFLKNVPAVVSGSACDEFMNNGRFTCRELDPIEKKIKKKKKKTSEKSSDKKTKKTSKKKKKKK